MSLTLQINILTSCPNYPQLVWLLKMFDFSIDFFKLSSMIANITNKFSAVIAHSNFVLALGFLGQYNQVFGFQILLYLISQFIFILFFLFFNLFAFADLSSFLSIPTQKDSVAAVSPLWQQVVLLNEAVVKGYNKPNDTRFFFLFFFQFVTICTWCL